ncbi:MAG: hypothetical protein ACYC5A_04910 [Thermoleophilia bacterium]
MTAMKLCPTCAAELSPYHLDDSYAEGFVCKSGHRFFAISHEVLSSGSARATSMPAHEGKTNDLEVIRKWLTEPKFRATLNSQLATVLRRIYEISKYDRHIESEAEPFKSCPICGDLLSKFDQDDCWVQGKRCANHHKFYERGGNLHFSVAEQRHNLSTEMSDISLYSLVDAWLGKNRLLREQVHPDVREVMKRFRSNST